MRDQVLGTAHVRAEGVGTLPGGHEGVSNRARPGLEQLQIEEAGKVVHQSRTMEKIVLELGLVVLRNREMRDEHEHDRLTRSSSTHAWSPVHLTEPRYQQFDQGPTLLGHVAAWEANVDTRQRTLFRHVPNGQSYGQRVAACAVQSTGNDRA